MQGSRTDVRHLKMTAVFCMRIMPKPVGKMAHPLHQVRASLTWLFVNFVWSLLGTRTTIVVGRLSPWNQILESLSRRRVHSLRVPAFEILGAPMNSLSLGRLRSSVKGPDTFTYAAPKSKNQTDLPSALHREVGRHIRMCCTKRQKICFSLQYA